MVASLDHDIPNDHALRLEMLGNTMSLGSAYNYGVLQKQLITSWGEIGTVQCGIDCHAAPKIFSNLRHLDLLAMFVKHYVCI